MKLLYKLSGLVLLLLLSHQPSQAIATSNDSIIYKMVVDSLIQIALANKQLHPIVIISRSERLSKSKNFAGESLNETVHSYAEDSINYLRTAGNRKVLRNGQLRDILLSVTFFNRNNIPLPDSESPAQIRYKSNGWNLFKSYKKIKRYRERNPEFFCVADITKPVYAGDYAVVVIDRQFNPLGGGGYMQIFKKTERKWLTYALVTLWNY